MDYKLKQKYISEKRKEARHYRELWHKSGDRELYRQWKEGNASCYTRWKESADKVLEKHYNDAANAAAQAEDKSSYPGGHAQVIKDKRAVKEGDREAMKRILSYLEEDLYCHGSGYQKEILIRALKTSKILNEERDRILALILQIIDCADRREFKDYCKLASRIYGDELKAGILDRLSSPNNDIRRRARWILEYCEKTRKYPTKIL